MPDAEPTPLRDLSVLDFDATVARYSKDNGAFHRAAWIADMVLYKRTPSEQAYAQRERMPPDHWQWLSGVYHRQWFKFVGTYVQAVVRGNAAQAERMKKETDRLVKKMAKLADAVELEA